MGANNVTVAPVIEPIIPPIIPPTNPQLSDAIITLPI